MPMQAGSVITHGQEALSGPFAGALRKAGRPGLRRDRRAEQRRAGARARRGHVQIGHDIRLGQVGWNENDDAVEGIILLRKGFDTLETCLLIREKIKKLNDTVLPSGAHIVPIYDRTELIHRSSHTVFHNIIFGVFLVCVISSLGFGSVYWPLTLAVVLVIPFSLLVAFAGMKLCGYSPNLISLGAVDFGIMIETAVFAAESVIFYLAQKERWNRETVDRCSARSARARALMRGSFTRCLYPDSFAPAD